MIRDTVKARAAVVDSVPAESICVYRLTRLLRNSRHNRVQVRWCFSYCNSQLVPVFVFNEAS